MLQFSIWSLIRCASPTIEDKPFTPKSSQYCYHSHHNLSLRYKPLSCTAESSPHNPLCTRLPPSFAAAAAVTLDIYTAQGPHKGDLHLRGKGTPVMTSWESWMKGAQRRLETKERSSTDPRIMLWFGPLGFRSQPILAALVPRPHIHSMLWAELFTTLLLASICVCGATGVLYYGEIRASTYIAPSDVSMKFCPLRLSQHYSLPYFHFAAEFQRVSFLFAFVNMHCTVEPWASLAPNSFLWTSFKWKLYNYNPCETLPLWWENEDFFHVKHAFLVMQLPMLSLVPTEGGGSERLLDVCFASKRTIAKIMAAIELFFSTRPAHRGPMRQSCSSNLLFCMASTFNWARHGLLAQ